MPTAFVATWGTGKPVIGINCEYDALPGLSQHPVADKKPVVEGAPGEGRQDEGRRRGMSETAHGGFDSSFSEDTMIADLERLYAELTGGD